MRLVDDTSGKTDNSSVALNKIDLESASQARCIDAAISLMSNIVETACERSPDLDLMRLVNLMDLYCVYLQQASDPQSDVYEYIKSINSSSDAVVTQKLGSTELMSFERFVRDSQLLSITAHAASSQSGELVAPPLPLTVSAND